MAPIGNTFKSSLGNFALPHTDNNDEAAALTAMAIIPSVPKDYSMGIFALHDFMVFIKPSGPSIVFFSGLHRHGGTAPSPPPGKPSVKWAYRLTVVCYPNCATLRGSARASLLPIPNCDVFNIPLEFCWRQQ